MKACLEIFIKAENQAGRTVFSTFKYFGLI